MRTASTAKFLQADPRTYVAHPTVRLRHCRYTPRALGALLRPGIPSLGPVTKTARTPSWRPLGRSGRYVPKRSVTYTFGCLTPAPGSAKGSENHRGSRPMRAAIYCRVSTREQNADNQLAELRRVAAHKGWDVVAEYVEDGVSGAKTREKRPRFSALWKDATRGKYDVVMFWSVDRAGRSVAEVARFMDEMGNLGVRQYYHRQAIDSDTPTGRAMLQMCTIFAEMERSLLIERTHAGLDRARRQGKRLGRPPLEPHVERRIRELAGQGLTLRGIAQQVGRSHETVRRVLGRQEGR